MSVYRTALMRLRALLSRPRLEREMQDEMRAHLEQATERLVARGMSPSDAAIAARREFGNVAVIEEDARDARGSRWLESVVADVRFALRFLRRNPTSTTTIVLVLSLGIGVNSALFSMIQSITMRPVPGMRLDKRHVQLHVVEQGTRGARWQRRNMSYGELMDLNARTETFSAVAGFASVDVILDREDVGSREMVAQFVTPNYFTTLGVAPARGQGLRGASDAGALDVVIADALWDELFARSDTAIGSVLRLNKVEVRVVGVAPPRFQGPFISRQPTTLWLPLSARAAIVNGTDAWRASPDSLLFRGFARLAPGVTAGQATQVARGAASAALARRVLPAARNAVWSAEVVSLRAMPRLAEDPETLLMLAGIWFAALLILLVACMNVSSLLVASAIGRRHEIAVRLSLGASRMRVVRQLVTESALLAVAGGLIGLFIYWSVMQVMAARITNADLAPDFGTLAFTMVFAIGTGILFGLSPSLHATRAGIASAMKDSGGSGRRSRLQGVFVVAQIALTQPILVVLALLLWAVMTGQSRLPDKDVGSRVVEVRFQISAGASTTATRRASARAVMDRMGQEAGVTAIVPEPAGFLIRNVGVAPADRGDGPRANEEIRLVVEGTSPGYFALMEIPIVLGRDLQFADTTGREMAVVVPSDLARGWWGGANPIGRKLEIPGWEPGREQKTESRTTLVVVGVFDVNKATTRGGNNRIFTANGGLWRRDLFLVKTSGPAAALVPTLRRFARDAAKDVPVLSVGTLNDRMARNRVESLQISSGVATSGGLALLLASIGLYGVVSLAVNQRRREIGVRIALGGKPLRVARMFFASGVRLSILGLAVGLPLSLAGVRFFYTTQLMGADVSFTLIAACIAGTVLAVGSLATWLPARRAATVNPAVVLREE